MDVPASIRRSLPLGMIGKVFIFIVFRLKINGKNASNGKSESSLRYSMRIATISTFILNFD